MADADRRAGLLDDAALEVSAVVANCAMNRERQLVGVNSYARELRFNPLDVIVAQIRARPRVRARLGGWTCAAVQAGR